MLHFFHVVIFSCFTFFVLHSFCVELWLSYIISMLDFFPCCTLYMLYFFHAALIPCCTFCALHSFHVAPILRCIFLGVHSFHVTLFSNLIFFFSCCFMLHSVYASLFWCWTSFRLHFFRVALFSSCILFMLHFFCVIYFFHVPPFVVSLHVAFISCSTFSRYSLMMYCGNVSFFSCCFVLHLFRVALY